MLTSQLNVYTVVNRW